MTNFSGNTMLLYLRILEMLIPILVEICLMGFRNRQVIDYIKFFQLQSHESRWFFKIVFIQMTICTSLFFSMLIMCGIFMKEQMPRKLILVGSIVQVLFCIVSSYYQLQLHKDMDRFQLLIGSLGTGFNGLLFAIDAFIMLQKILLSRARPS